MIRLINPENRQPVIKKIMYHNKDIFTQARDFYYNNARYKGEQIAVYDDNDNLLYMLAYEPNKLTYPRLSKDVKLNLYVSDFDKYDYDSPHIDFEYIKDIDEFIFREVEEYTVWVTKVILRYFPEKKISYTDKTARLFFEDDVDIIEDDGYFVLGEKGSEDAYHGDKADKNVLRVGSEMIYSIHFGAGVLKKRRASSLNLMSSLYWLSDVKSFGDRNPDKTFYVIKSPIASSGLVKFISYLLYFVSVAESKDMDVIPVIDTAIAGDDNQFNDGVYKDVWSMFFKGVSEYSLEEVYNSKNVIVGEEGKMGANPYLMYVEYHSNIGPLMKDYLVLNDTLEEYCTKIREGLAFEEGSKILGVVGRGSDFNNPGVAALHTLPLDPQGIVDKARQVYKSGGYDYIFLATEDQNVFDTFMASDLKEVTRHIEQKRYTIDASKELLHNKYVEESKAGNRNGFEEAKGYISILEMLKRCDGIVASTDCGALDYAMAMRDGELTDLYIHGADSNKFLQDK